MIDTFGVDVFTSALWAAIKVAALGLAFMTVMLALVATTENVIRRLGPGGKGRGGKTP